MKHSTHFYLFLAVILAILSCQKDKVEKSKLKSFFAIEKAELREKTFPDAKSGAPEFAEFYANNSVLAGGSNLISLASSSGFKSILVGVTGETGYYQISKSDLQTSGGLYVLPLLISQDLEASDFEIIVALVGGNGHVGIHQAFGVTKVDAGTGKLQISCSWDQLNDVDLHLFEPNGFHIDYGNDISPNGGKLDVDSNAACGIDGINNENITYSYDAGVSVENGEYNVIINFYDNCTVQRSTNFIVTAYYEGALITPSHGKNPYYGSFDPVDEDEDIQVMKFTID